MESQNFALLVSLASSVTVVLISSAANIWSKRIDVQQKKQDWNLEFSKIYATRKIDAGEAVIGRSNMLIMQARTLKELVNAYVNRYSYYHKVGDSQIKSDVEKVSGLMVTDKAAYRLYFDADGQSQAISVIASKCSHLLSEIVAGLEAKKQLVEVTEDKNIIKVSAANSPAWNSIQSVLENKLLEYNKMNDELQSLLLENCRYFRAQLSKYNSHE